MFTLLFIHPDGSVNSVSFVCTRISSDQPILLYSPCLRAMPWQNHRFPPPVPTPHRDMKSATDGHPVKFDCMNCSVSVRFVSTLMRVVALKDVAKSNVVTEESDASEAVSGLQLNGYFTFAKSNLDFVESDRCMAMGSSNP